MPREGLAFRMRRKLWTLLSDEKSWARHNLTNFRDRERFGVISRPNYLYGMLRAADLAKYCGKKSVTVIEFGVASGAGLLNMIELAPLIERETNVRLRIVGFDTGKGLPTVEGYKDHPELWTPGDFTNEDRDGLIRRLDGRAEIIWGDIADTVGPFSDAIDEAAPIGFVAIDVDIYSATTQALRCLTRSPEKYTLAVSMYFDDVAMFFANDWCGELAAISEFNIQNNLRKIGIDRSLPGQRPEKTETWYPQMYVCHVLDHELRQAAQSRNKLSITDHYNFIGTRHLI